MAIITVDQVIGDARTRASEHAKRELDYYEKWAPRLRVSVFLIRTAAIMLATFAAIVPLLKVTQQFKDLYDVNASIALAVAAGLIGIDQFFGLSRAWVRFERTKRVIQRELWRYETEWNLEQLDLAGQDPRIEQARDLLRATKRFEEKVSAIIIAETEEFERGLLDRVEDKDQKEDEKNKDSARH